VSAVKNSPKMAFECHQTSFSYLDRDTREERFVGVPEQEAEMISPDPLAPVSVYLGRDDHGKVGLYRLEVGCAPEPASSGSLVVLTGR
jgi:ATP-dependent Lon protease